jgi:DNA-binding transcriptional ArsR family regulator
LSRANSSAHAELSSIDMLPVSAIGLALTATELAYCANVSRSTASGHLSKLVAARLLTVTRKRRFSYYRIASPLVATMLESIENLHLGDLCTPAFAHVEVPLASVDIEASRSEPGTWGLRIDTATAQRFDR